MKNPLPKGFKCFKCFVIFYLVFMSILEIATVFFGSFLLIFREEKRIPAARNIVLYFLLAPTILSILSTIIGWWAIKKKKIKLLKFFAVLLAVTAVVEISGCVWCFVSLPEVSEEIKIHLKVQYESMIVNSDKTWFNNLQSKHKCCGLNGPTDYHSSESIPTSCCGYDPDDRKSGSCTFLWQKGCINVIERQINYDLITLSLIVLCVAVLRIPGAILSWCFANKMSKERL